MSLKERIHADMTDALKRRAGSEAAGLELATLRVLFAEIRNKEIELRHELDDDEVVEVVAREHKRRKEAAEEYAKGGREDLVARETAEADILTVYLPEQLGDEEVATLVGEAIAATGAEDPKAMGQVMGWLAPRLKGRADMKAVSRTVADRLAGRT